MVKHAMYYPQIKMRLDDGQFEKQSWINIIQAEPENKTKLSRQIAQFVII